MRKLFRSKKDKRNTIIIKDHVIRFVQAEQPDLRTTGFFDERYLPEGVIKNGEVEDRDTLQQILIECFDQWKLERQPVQFCVPDAYVFIRKVSLPDEIDETKVQGYLFMELGEEIPIPFADPIFDYLYVEDEHAVIVFAAPKEYIEEYNSVMKEAGGRPNAADISSLCLYRTLTEIDDGGEEDHLLLLKIHLHSMVASIYHKDKPLFYRYVPLDVPDGAWRIEEGQPIWAGMEEELLSLAHVVAEESEGMARFYEFSMQSGRHGITRVVLCGDHPYLSLFESVLKESLDASVQVCNNEEYLPLRFYENLGLILKQNIRT